MTGLDILAIAQRMESEVDGLSKISKERVDEDETSKASSEESDSESMLQKKEVNLAKKLV